MNPLAALLTDVVLSALWPIVGQAGTRLFHPVLFSQFGIAIGLLSVLPWLLREGRWRRVIAAENRRALAMVGIFGSGLPSLSLILGLSFTTPSNAAIVAQVEVLYSAALCALVLKERIGAAQAAASALVLAGTAVILAHDLSSPRWKGDAIILATPWMFQVSHIFAKRLPKDLDEATITGARLFYGMLSLLPFTAWTLASGSARASWTPAAACWLVAQGIGMYSLNHFLWYVAIRRMDLAKATAIILSYPAFTVGFSWLLGLETMRAAQAGGLALTLAGAYWLSTLVLKSSREQATTATGFAEP
ncbi:MAG: DMT family transporter [Elusimicrobia bacterium]|nr:DMT family transporter [Elusimicrobiota bacterium]